MRVSVSFCDDELTLAAVRVRPSWLGWLLGDSRVRRQRGAIWHRLALRNRDWQSTQGWGKGSDPGTPARGPLPAREVTYQRHGCDVTRRVPASAGSTGRPSTISHDPCPPCLKADREALEQRKVKRSARLVALDAKRKERDAMMRHATLQKAAVAR